MKPLFRAWPSRVPILATKKREPRSAPAWVIRCRRRSEAFADLKAQELGHSDLVAERLGGVDSDESDDDEFASGLERARSARRRGGDEEEGFGFVSQADLTRREEERARKKREEERRALEAERARRKAEKLAKKEAKREAKRGRERAREAEHDDDRQVEEVVDGGAVDRVGEELVDLLDDVAAKVAEEEPVPLVDWPAERLEEELDSSDKSLLH